MKPRGRDRRVVPVSTVPSNGRGEAVTTDKHPMQGAVESLDEGIGQQGDLKAVAHQFTKAMVSDMNGPDAQCRIAHL